MKSHRPAEAEHTLAVFIDFENLALGFNSRRDRFNVEKVLERLVEKGKIVVKRAYCDWSRFGNYTAPLHEAAIELIEIPKRAASGKNSADIRLVVDAMDLAYSKDHIDTFVIVSGDSDFSPLVSKLKELGKHVIGLGLVDATSHLLRDNCDEFIYYEDLGRARPTLPDGQLPEAKQKLFELLMDSLVALRREGKDAIYSSMVKDTMKRKKPSFNEEYHGYRTFSELLEDAQQAGLLDLEKAKTSGTYVVTRFGTEPKAPPKPSDRSTQRAIQPEPAPRPVSDRSTQRQMPVEQPPSVRSDRSTQRPLPPEQPPVRSDRSTQRQLPVEQPVRSDRSTQRPLPVEPAPRRETTSDRSTERRREQPPPPRPREVEEDDRSFGRALIDDIEPLDEVPSYRPKPKPVPAEQPAPKPRTRAEQPAAPAVKPKASEPAKPKAAEPAKPASGRRRTAEAPPKPKPKPVDDADGFGAGLDD